MKKYEQIDIAGDAGLILRGDTLENLFRNAAEGMFSLITNTDSIEETEEKDISLKADNNETLLIQWLNELVFLFDTYGFIGKQYVIDLQDNKINAKVSGGFFDPETNESGLLIKAATYHNISLKKVNSHWEATVIFDI